jgi:hypothetical protein
MRPLQNHAKLTFNLTICSGEPIDTVNTVVEDLKPVHMRGLPIQIFVARGLFD